MLGGRRFDGGLQRGGELALIGDAFEHGAAALLKLTQIRQTGFEFAQLNVIQATGGFFAVTGDEGNGGAPIEQFDGGADLGFGNLDFRGELTGNFLHNPRVCHRPVRARFYTLQMDRIVQSAKKAATRPAAKRARSTTRTNDPERTKAGIMAVATQEFSANGLTGARIDAIAAATHTSKRMIYYYFGSKEGLYLAVLEEAYRSVRHVEAQLQLKDLPPQQALERLVGFTFDHHHAHQDFIRLVMSENIQRGAFLSQSNLIQDLNVSVIDAIQELYQRGVADGVFRAGLDPIDIHASISALSFFNVSNRYTFDLIFKRKGHAPKALAARRQSVIDMVLRFVCHSNSL